MLKKADEKLITAKIDLNNHCFNDCISCAYYAVFHAISAMLLSKGLTFSSHSQVIGMFNKEFVKSGIFPIATTKEIQKLFESRQHSDYDFETEFTENEADKLLEKANEIVISCRNFLER